MKLMDYETPKLFVLRLEEEDVIKTSDGGTSSYKKMFDKGVEDFFED